MFFSLLWIVLSFPLERNTVAATVPAASAVDCYSDPGHPSCRNFRQDDATSRKQIEQLCHAMPGMVGCTLWRACQNSTASGRYCAPFSLVGDICERDMPSMRGCEGFVSLCGNASSVVGQCKDEAPIKHVLLSDEATQAVLSMCSTHGMPECSDCPSRYKCPDPLATLGALCLGMPTMAECSGFFSMCEEARGTFRGLCGEERGRQAVLPPMKMYLHQSVEDLILFKFWITRSNATYAASCLAVFLAGLLVQLLKAWRVVVEQRWALERLERKLQGKGCTGPSPPCMPPTYSMPATAQGGGQGTELRQSPGGVGEGGGVNEERGTGGSRSGRRRKGRVPEGEGDAAQLREPLLGTRGESGRDAGVRRRNAVRAAFTVVVVLLDYLLMLVVMCFNVGIILCTVAGFGVGALLLGHVSEGMGVRGGGMGSMPGPPDPDAGSTLELQFAAEPPMGACCC